MFILKEEYLDMKRGLKSLENSVYSKDRRIESQSTKIKELEIEIDDLIKSMPISKWEVFLVDVGAQEIEARNFIDVGDSYKFYIDGYNIVGEFPSRNVLSICKINWKTLKLQ